MTLLKKKLKTPEDKVRSLPNTQPQATPVATRSIRFIVRLRARSPEAITPSSRPSRIQAMYPESMVL
jgi:hypothetical protein